MGSLSVNEQSFDFIVVGGMHALSLEREWHDLTRPSGGTAGNVVAGRLAENPNVSVLVIEAGPGYGLLCHRLLTSD